MASPSPSFILKKSAQAITDLNFWTDCFSNTPYDKTQKELQYLIAGYSNQEGFHVWDLKTRRVVAHHHSNYGIVSVCGMENGELVALNREGELMLIEILSESGLTRVKHQLYIPNVGFCKASCLLRRSIILTAVTGEETSSINVWDLSNQKLIFQLIPRKDFKLGMVMSIKLFEKDDSSLYALGGYEDGSISLWEVAASRMLCNIKLFEDVPVICMDFDTKQMSGVAGSPSETLIKFEVKFNDIDNKNELEITKTIILPNAGIADVKIRPDGKIVAAGGWNDGSVRIFSLKTLKPLAVLRYHDGTVQAIAFRRSLDSSGQILGSGSETHKIAIWNIYNS